MCGNRRPKRDFGPLSPRTTFWCLVSWSAQRDLPHDIRPRSPPGPIEPAERSGEAWRWQSADCDDPAHHPAVKPRPILTLRPPELSGRNAEHLTEVTRQVALVGKPVHHSKLGHRCLRWVGCAKTKSDLVVMPSEGFPQEQTFAGALRTAVSCHKLPLARLTRSTCRPGGELTRELQARFAWQFSG